MNDCNCIFVGLPASYITSLQRAQMLQPDESSALIGRHTFLGSPYNKHGRHCSTVCHPLLSVDEHCKSKTLNVSKKNTERTAPILSMIYSI